jgi:hypothetical protein
MKSNSFKEDSNRKTEASKKTPICACARKKTEDKLKETLTKLESLNEKLSLVSKFTRHDTRNKPSTIANSAYLA